MEDTDDPDACFFGDCRFRCLIDEPDLNRIRELASESIEHQAYPATKERRERHHYQRKPDLFRSACEMFEIPPGPVMRKARVWVDLFARDATDAHEGDACVDDLEDEEMEE